MKRLFVWLLWAVALAGLCVGLDQFLLHARLDSPIFQPAQTFYRDFRSRVVQVGKKEEHRLEEVKKEWPPKIELPNPTETIDKIKPLVETQGKKLKTLVQSQEEPGGYVYVDKSGELHLTSRLEEVPKEYRDSAKPLKK